MWKLEVRIVGLSTGLVTLFFHTLSPLCKICRDSLSCNKFGEPEDRSWSIWIHKAR
jgi:hypothetical protein